MHLVEVCRFEEWLPLVGAVFSKVCNRLALLYNVRTEWPFPFLVLFVVLDAHQPCPVDILVISEKLFLIDCKLVLLLITAIPCSEPALLWVDRLMHPSAAALHVSKQVGPQVGDTWKHWFNSSM